MDLSSASAPTAVSHDQLGEVDTRLHGRWLVLAWVTWAALVVLTLGVFVVSIPVYVAQLQTIGLSATTCTSQHLTPDTAPVLRNLGLSVESYTLFSVALIVASALGWFTVGGVIVWHKPTDWMSLLVAMMLVTEGVVGTSCLPSPLEKSSLAWRLPIHFLYFLGPVLFLLVFSLFPDGRFVPRWTRWLVVALSAAYVPPAFIPDLPFSGVFSKLFVLGVSTFLVVAQLYRYWHVSSTIQRQQTKWVVFAVTVGLVIFTGWYLPAMIFPSLSLPGSHSSLVSHPAFTFLTLLVPLGSPIFAFFTLLVPLSLGIAILRYRLWDIDVIINRTLVYGTLTVSILSIYVLVVGVLGILLQTQGNPMISLLAAGLIAVLFQHLRDRLQRGVNRLMYGECDDPYLVLSRLGQRLEATLAPQAVLPTIVETIAQALKLPYVAITLKQGDEFTIAASYGASLDGSLRLPLVYQTELVGELLLVPRMHGDSFTAADHRLLDDLARQAGVAVYAVRLTADLQRSCGRLVTAREEERRRLRRDLHDGLGSQLASQTLILTAARKLLKHDPNAAEALLADATAHAEEAITDIRRLVYALRPPALDDLGLVAALHEQTTEYRASGVSLSFEAPDPLPPLSATVEVACYRIAQEALTNVLRHAHAQTCTVRLTLGERLSLEIIDDGIGLPASFRAGVGLTSMHERAIELGGTCLIESMTNSGTRVYAQLPLS
jgi:signal transduction histidine kinase